MRSFAFGLVLAWLCVMCGGKTSTDDAGVPDASADAAKCVLQASSYSTTCTADADCTGVFLGDACSSSCFCPTGAIAMSSRPQYEADYAATSHGGNTCFCPVTPPITCCAGTCALGACDAGK